MKEPQMLMNFSYMGMNDKNQWVRITAHAGGVTENIVQSIAGDLLWHGITKADQGGLPVILHVHDEIAVEVPESQAEAALDKLQQAMTSQPPWAHDMWLGADGFITNRYTKD
jgi:DNA polymerase